MNASRWISPGLALIATYLVIAILMQTVGFTVSWGVSQVHADIGYDLVWWGVVNLVVLETGLISPPFGIHLFVLKSIAGANVPLGTVYRGVLPFVISDLIKLVLIVLFPALCLWLPSTMVK